MKQTESRSPPELHHGQYSFVTILYGCFLTPPDLDLMIVSIDTFLSLFGGELAKVQEYENTVQVTWLFVVSIRVIGPFLPTVEPLYNGHHWDQRYCPL